MPKYDELIAACTNMRQRYLHRPFGEGGVPASTIRRWFVWLDVMRTCFIEEDMPTFMSEYARWQKEDFENFCNFIDEYWEILGVTHTAHCSSFDDFRSQFLV